MVSTNDWATGSTGVPVWGGGGITCWVVGGEVVGGGRVVEGGVDGGVVDGVVPGVVAGDPAGVTPAARPIDDVGTSRPSACSTDRSTPIRSTP